MEIFLTMYTVQSVVSVSSMLCYQSLSRFSSSSRHKGSSQNEENSGGLVSSHWTESICIAGCELGDSGWGFWRGCKFPKDALQIDTTGFISKTFYKSLLRLLMVLSFILWFFSFLKPRGSLSWFPGHVGLQPLWAGAVCLGSIAGPALPEGPYKQRLQQYSGGTEFSENDTSRVIQYLFPVRWRESYYQIYPMFSSLSHHESLDESLSLSVLPRSV